jgi:polysaccharide export outer membrane protein
VIVRRLKEQMLYRAALVLVVLLFALVLPASADYLLAPDDVIEINVWREPELSRKQIQISIDGNIIVPYLNLPIKAAGLTTEQLTRRICDEYVRAEILTNPRIDVNLVNKHRMMVWVFGQVQRPGAIPFKEGDSVTSAVAEAGSYTTDAMLEVAQLTRRGADKPTIVDLKKLYHDGDLTQNYGLQEGDVIYIPEDTFNRYYVIGEVQRQGMYALRDNTTVLSAVYQAGGQTERASMKNVMLIRGDMQHPEKRVVNLAKMTEGDLSQDVRLEAGDVVYVPETSKPDWSKISQLLNVVTSLGVIRRYGIF